MIRVAQAASLLVSAASRNELSFRFRGEQIHPVSTRELIEKEVAALLEPLQRKVYEFALRLRNNTDEPFNGAELSESALARDWNSPEEDAAWANL